jgi:hypothetical protein
VWNPGSTTPKPLPSYRESLLRWASSWSAGLH